MIRKSLQSRASSRATMRPEDNYDTEEEEEDRAASLRTDWKAYEADIQRNKSVLMRSHPGVDRARIQNRGGPSRPPPQSFGSSSSNPYSPISPTSTNSATSPASPGFTALESPASPSHTLLPALSARATLGDDLAIVTLTHVAGISLADPRCNEESGSVEKNKLKNRIIIRDLVVEVLNLELARAGFAHLPAQSLPSTADFVELLLTTDDKSLLEANHAQGLSKGGAEIPSANTNDTGLENILNRVGQRT
ncbi:hypothetical protein HG530_004948 [Fusarium avenaceum]|nr:hypothetical protein HG530_004948 [Fusarium avenaceum]